VFSIAVIDVPGGQSRGNKSGVAREARMRIHTLFSGADRTTFGRLKRKKWTAWKFLISGEWSQTPWHQGNHRFFISSTADKTWWALLNTGFPSRIVAVATETAGLTLEEIAGKMLTRIYREGGDSLRESTPTGTSTGTV
jgi:hypothetical protein